MKAQHAVTPLALVVLAVGAVSYAYFVDRGRVSDADRSVRRRDVFPSFRVESVRRVELVHASEKLVLEREADAGAVWAMTSPQREPIDAATVDALLRELEMATRVRDVQDSDSAGLDAPRVRGSVVVGPLEYHFVLGADAIAPEGAAYMRIEGEGTFVVGRSLKVQLLRGADAYRDRTFVAYGASEIAQVDVQERAGNGGFVLKRHGTSFRVGGVAGLRASGVAVDRIFGALAEARAGRFLDDAAAARSRSESSMTVVLLPRDSTRPRVRLVVGGTCPVANDAVAASAGAGPKPAADALERDVVLLRTEPSPMSACVDRALTEALFVNSETLVDKSPFMAHADEIEELRIDRLDAEGSRIDLARLGAGWHERAPADRDLSSGEADSANTLAAALAGARAIDVRRAEPGDRLVARARVTIVPAGGGADEIVETGAPDASGVVLAKRLDDGALLRLSRASARRFEPHPIALEARAVWLPSFDPGAVVVIDDSCSRATQRLELQDGVWKARGFEVDARSAAEIADAFARAKADAWVAENDDGAFGFEGEGSCAVMLALASVPEAGAPRRVGIIFGDAGEGGVYARTLDASGVFIAPVSLRELASHPAVARDGFRVDPERVTRVVLVRDGVKLALSRARAGDRLERTDGDEASPDDRLETALASLAAGAAVHTGPPAREEGIERPTLEIDATQRGGAGGSVETRIVIGAPTRAGTTDAYFARASGVDATFAVPKTLVDAILDAW